MDDAPTFKFEKVAQWKAIAVNEAFGKLMDALDRAARKGYMPDAMADEWDEFDWRDDPSIAARSDVHQAGALRGEPEAAGHGSVEGDVRALRQMVADCDVYLKEGETPAQRIDRERRDTEAVLNLLIREKQRTEAMREVMLRMMAGIDHLAEIARQWEPDYSSGADRRGWVLAKDARDDAARLIPETHQAASGCSHTARSDGQGDEIACEEAWMLPAGTKLYTRPAAAEQGATPPAPAAPLGDGEQLWLWQNGDHFFAFRHLYPCFSPGGDPMTLGEPFGRAIFKHSHNRQGRPNEQQRTDRQSPRSSPDPDLQRRHAASAGQACSVGAGASLGHSQHPIAPQVGWGAGDDGARSQSVPDIAGAAGVLAAAGNVAEGVAALAASPQPAALKCGHHKSLMLLSAETGQPLYCELCDAISGRRDAELMEAELRAKLAALAASPQPAAPVEDTMQIPRSALRWLFGEEGEFECPPRLYFRGKPPGYWWRAVFREKIAAPAEGGAS